MERTILFLFALSIGAVHAATVESRPLNIDSGSLDTKKEIKSTWINDVKKDDTNRITEFQAKYRDDVWGISVIYVIPFNLGHNDSNCENQDIRFEFDKKKFGGNNIDITSGNIWVDNAHYFNIYQNIKNTDDKSFIELDEKNFDSYLNTGKNLKITFSNTRNAEKTFRDVFGNLKKSLNPTFDVWIPFVGAKDQIIKAQNSCVEYRKIEETKFEAEKAKREKAIAAEKAKRDKEIKQRSAEIERQNAEVQKRIAAQKKKPDVQIGMTRQQVVKNTRWGTPMKINSTRTKYGTSEQWIYWGYKYLYFENGELVAIQE